MHLQQQQQQQQLQQQPQQQQQPLQQLTLFQMHRILKEAVALGGLRGQPIFQKKPSMQTLNNSEGTITRQKSEANIADATAEIALHKVKLISHAAAATGHTKKVSQQQQQQQQLNMHQQQKQQLQHQLLFDPRRIRSGTMHQIGKSAAATAVKYVEGSQNLTSRIAHGTNFHDHNHLRMLLHSNDQNEQILRLFALQAQQQSLLHTKISQHSKQHNSFTQSTTTTSPPQQPQPQQQQQQSSSSQQQKTLNTAISIRQEGLRALKLNSAAALYPMNQIRQRAKPTNTKQQSKQTGILLLPNLQTQTRQQNQIERAKQNNKNSKSNPNNNNNNSKNNENNYQGSCSSRSNSNNNSLQQSLSQARVGLANEVEKNELLESINLRAASSELIIDASSVEERAQKQQGYEQILIQSHETDQTSRRRKRSIETMLQSQQKSKEIYPQIPTQLLQGSKSAECSNLNSHRQQQQQQQQAVTRVKSPSENLPILTNPFLQIIGGPPNRARATQPIKRKGGRIPRIEEQLQKQLIQHLKSNQISLETFSQPRNQLSQQLASLVQQYEHKYQSHDSAAEHQAIASQQQNVTQTEPVGSRSPNKISYDSPNVRFTRSNKQSPFQIRRLILNPSHRNTHTKGFNVSNESSSAFISEEESQIRKQNYRIPVGDNQSIHPFSEQSQFSLQQQQSQQFPSQYSEPRKQFRSTSLYGYMQQSNHSCNDQEDISTIPFSAVSIEQLRSTGKQLKMNYSPDSLLLKKSGKQIETRTMNPMHFEVVEEELGRKATSDLIRPWETVEVELTEEEENPGF